MPCQQQCKWDGGQGRNRTADASLFRAALYRLSYLAVTRRKLEFSKPDYQERVTRNLGRNPGILP